MAIYNNKDKERPSLLEQTAKQNPSNLLIKEPIDRNVAGLLGTGVTPTTPEGFEGSSKAVYTHNDSQASIKDQMNANSKLWWDAKAAGDTDWMKSLEAANQQLAALLGDGVTYNPSSGTWSGVSDMPATQQVAMNTGVTPVLPTYDASAWEKENPRPSFDYAGYQAANPLPTYESAYNEKIDQLINEMLNREKFSYNAENDPLFQQYKSIYTREGNRSMNDTLAAAAAGAGGMSSYAMTAAQQANNYYMAQLGDMIPELQQLAYEMYMNDLNTQRQDIGMLMDKDSYDYSKYRDQVGDWYNNRDFSYGMYRDSTNDWYNDRNFAYGQYRDQMDDYKWGTEFNYGASRDAIADQRYDTEWQHMLEREGIEDQRYDTEWQHGLTRDQIEDAWREKEFNYGVSRDQISDSRNNSSEAYNRAMDLLMAGAMPDDNLLTQAGISKEQAETILAGGFYWDGDTSGSDDSSVDDPESEDKFWSSVNALGIGPRNASFILELAKYGGVIENADGTVEWADGWNAHNYEEKLKQVKGSSPFGFMPGF